MIRDAQAEDLSKMRGIETAAGEAFRRVGMAAIADDPPPALDTLAAYQQDGRAWVATDSADDRSPTFCSTSSIGPHTSSR